MATTTNVKKKNVESEIVFAYLPVPKETFEGPQESSGDKLIRKMKQNPFVPVGLTLTTFALSYGLWQMKSGNAALSQKMMRMRIGAQGITVAAVLIGVMYGHHLK